jgi:hypothetical protein
MESTGVYWIPLFQILETSGLEVRLVNALVSDATGVTGMAIIRAIIAGERDPQRLAIELLMLFGLLLNLWLIVKLLWVVFIAAFALVRGSLSRLPQQHTSWHGSFTICGLLVKTLSILVPMLMSNSINNECSNISNNVSNRWVSS